MLPAWNIPKLTSELFHQHIIHVIGLKGKIHQILTDFIFRLFREVGQMDAISHVNLPAFNAQFIGSEILTQDIVQYTFHLFLRQEVNGRNSKQISVFIHKIRISELPL